MAVGIIIHMPDSSTIHNIVELDCVSNMYNLKPGVHLVVSLTNAQQQVHTLTVSYCST